MWNKSSTEPPAKPAPNPEPRALAPEVSPRGVATIGPSITIKGDLSGEEDLLIEGRVQGEVLLHQHHVTVGPKGQVEADVYGRHICVEGQVKGNLRGEEVVVIRKSGKVEGNVTAPSVTLENGANFRGSIDMQPGGRSKKRSAKEPVNTPPQPSKPMGSKRAMARG